MISRLAAVIGLICLMPIGVRAEPLESGTAFLSETLRVQQADEAANPGMLWVSEGARLWSEPAGSQNRACVDCHGDATSSMRGVATRLPAVDESTGKLFNLEARINACRERHQQAEHLRYESDELLGLTAFVARQSAGLPLQVTIEGPAARFHQAGEALFHMRQGQLNLSCKQCHVDNVGKRLRGDTISHGLGVGYPVYRLEWQSLGSLHRRFRSCLFGVRAGQYEYGSDEFLALELYLAKRADGIPVETPAIRK